MTYPSPNVILQKQCGPRISPKVAREGRRNHILQNAFSSFKSFAPKKTSSPLDIMVSGSIITGSAPVTDGLSGGVGAVADEEESWNRISSARSKSSWDSPSGSKGDE
jgi:hypothetical protein